MQWIYKIWIASRSKGCQIEDIGIYFSTKSVLCLQGLGTESGWEWSLGGCTPSALSRLFMLALVIPSKWFSLILERTELGQLTSASAAEIQRRCTFQSGKTSNFSLLCIWSTAKSLIPASLWVRYVNEPLLFEQLFTTGVFWGQWGEFITITNKNCRSSFCFEGT